MYAVNGKYGNKTFSDFGLVICSIDKTAGLEVIDSMGSNLTYNLVKAPNSNKWNLYGTQYSNYMTITFQVAKFDTNKQLQPMDPDEYSSFMRWINRKNITDKFQPIQNGYSNIYFKGSFNANPLELCGQIYGAELTLTTDSPFGYLEIPQFKFTTTVTNQQVAINDQSDEIGYLYPDILTIKCNASGNLSITNSIENITMTINNVTSGEILTIDGENQIITSSLSAHDSVIYDDFNAEFLRIANTYDNRINTLTISIPCEITLKYSPIRKVGV